jgi:hypothetical protein
MQRRAVINSSGTITNLLIQDSGAVDTTQTAAARTITDCSVFGNGTLKTDLNTTITNGVSYNDGARTSQGDLPDGTLVTYAAAP